jgi:hypothetical protein
MGQDTPLLAGIEAQTRRDELSREQLLIALRGADGSQVVPAGFGLDEIIGGPDDPFVPVSRLGPGGGEQLLVFTGTATVHRWRASARFISAPGRLLFELADRLGVSEVVVDVDGPEPVRIEVGRGEHSPAPQARWNVRALSGPIDPRALFRLRSIFKGEPAIAAVYVAELCGRGDEELVVAFDIPGIGEQAAHQMIQELIPRIGALLPADEYSKGQFVGLMDDEFAPLVRSADAPIYRRT